MVRCSLIVAFASASVESRLLIQPFKEPVTGDDGSALNDLELGEIVLSHQLVSAGTGDAEKTCHVHHGEEQGKLISALKHRLLHSAYLLSSRIKKECRENISTLVGVGFLLFDQHVGVRKTVDVFRAVALGNDLGLHPDKVVGLESFNRFEP